MALSSRGGVTLFGVALFGTATSAMAFPGPIETFQPHLPFDGTSPVPTGAPVIGELVRRQLNRRQDEELIAYFAPDNTCGYLDGSSEAPFTCVDPEALCVLVNSIDGVNGPIACCNLQRPIVGCGFRSTCFGSDEVAAGLCGIQCQADTLSLKCTASDSPFCNSISFPGGAVDYFCAGGQETDVLNADTTFDGQVGRSYLSVDFGPWLTTNMDGTGGTGVIIPTDFNNIETIITTVTPTGIGAGESDEGDGTNVGAIVGGVVGGLAGLTLIGLGIWALLRRKQKNKKEVEVAAAAAPGGANSKLNELPASSPGPSPQPQMQQNAPIQGGFVSPGSPGQQPYYDPNVAPGAIPPYQYIQHNLYGPQQPYQPGSPPANYPNVPPGPPSAGMGVTAAGGYYGGKESLGTPEPNSGDSTRPVSDTTLISQQAPVSSTPSSGRGSHMPIQGGIPQGPVEVPSTPVGPQHGHHRGQLHELA